MNTDSKMPQPFEVGGLLSFQGCAPLEEMGQPGAPGMPVNSPVSACDRGDPPGRHVGSGRMGRARRDGLGTDTQIVPRRRSGGGHVGEAFAIPEFGVG